VTVEEDQIKKFKLGEESRQRESACSCKVGEETPLLEVDVELRVNRVNDFEEVH